MSLNPAFTTLFNINFSLYVQIVLAERAPDFIKLK